VGTANSCFYYGDGENDFVVAETIEEALELAKQKTGNQELTIENLNKMKML
jgi:valyl-tRNA synthetase